MLLDRISQCIREQAPNGSSSRLIIFGGENCGKTSIAFRMAYDSAQRGQVSMFVCDKEKMETAFPLTVNLEGQEGFDWCPSVLKNISMKYVASANDLVQVMASLHACHPMPSTLVIDDLSRIIDPINHDHIQVGKFMRTVAFIDDAMAHLESRKAVDCISTLLIITDSTSLMAHRHFGVLRRRIDAILTIKEDADTPPCRSYGLFLHIASVDTIQDAVPVFSDIMLSSEGCLIVKA